MKAQKSNILPTAPDKIEGQTTYNRELQKKLEAINRDIVTDIESLQSQITALEARVAALEP